jgi:hypothetical protein
MNWPFSDITPADIGRFAAKGEWHKVARAARMASNQVSKDLQMLKSYWEGVNGNSSFWGHTADTFIRAQSPQGKVVFHSPVAKVVEGEVVDNPVPGKKLRYRVVIIPMIHGPNKQKILGNPVQIIGHATYEEEGGQLTLWPDFRELEQLENTYSPQFLKDLAARIQKEGFQVTEIMDSDFPIDLS